MKGEQKRKTGRAAGWPDGGGGTGVVITHTHLGLAVRVDPADRPLGLGSIETLAGAMCQDEREREAFRGLGGGVTVDRALIASPLQRER